MKPVLVLSGHVVSLAIARSLAPFGIPVFVASYDGRDMAPFSRWVRGTLRVAHPERSEEQFVETIEQFGRSHEQPVLMPGDDPSLLVAARHRDRLKDAFLLACPDRAVAESVIDKRQTYAAAAKVGLEVPTTIAAMSAQECADASAAVGYPCLVKPSTCHGYFERLGVKYRLVHSGVEARKAFAEAQALGLSVVVQEWIRGGDEQGVNYNAYAINGEVKVEFTARKVRMVPVGGGVPGAVVSERVPDVVGSGRRILAALGLTGFACCEFKRGLSGGGFKLLEVNARHNRSALLAVRCGINFPLIDYEYVVNCRHPESLPFDPGRYWVDEFKDLAYFPHRVRMNVRNAFRFWKPYLRPPVCAVFDWTDPAPFVRRVGGGLQLVGRRIRSGGREMGRETSVSVSREVVP